MSVAWNTSDEFQIEVDKLKAKLQEIKDKKTSLDEQIS